MAKKTVIRITDDFDGAPNAVTRTFGLGGTWFEIDLAGQNLKDFDAFIDRHIDKAVPVRNGKPAANNGNGNGRITHAARRAANAEIRAFWKTNEKRLKLPAWRERGAIPRVVQDAHRRGA